MIISRRYSISVCFVYGLEEKDSKVIFAVCRLPLTSSSLFVYVSEPESELQTERWRNTLESEIYQEILIGVAVDEVHCVVEWGSSSSNKIVQRFVLFVCGIFVTLAILITTSFPGSLFSASPGRWKKDPGCGWSRDNL